MDTMMKRIKFNKEKNLAKKTKKIIKNKTEN